MKINSCSVQAIISMYSTLAVILTSGTREIALIFPAVFILRIRRPVFISLAHWFKQKWVSGGLNVLIMISLFALGTGRNMSG